MICNSLFLPFPPGIKEGKKILEINELISLQLLEASILIATAGDRPVTTTLWLTPVQSFYLLKNRQAHTEVRCQESCFPSVRLEGIFQFVTFSQTLLHM